MTRPWRYVDRPEDLQYVLRAMSAADVVGIDTESDSMHSYFEKVCLLQVSTPTEAFVVDPLSLEKEMRSLGPVFSNPRIRKVLHGSDYDIVCLRRDFDFQIRNLFDTMVAAQFLDLPKIGLADLVHEFFGVTLEKKYSRTNWGKRPLSESELEYSYLDVKYLIELAERVEERLVAADLLEEAEIEFARLEEREPNPREFDPDGYRRIRGAKGLPDDELSVLRELFVMRDRQARNMDRPPFKVIANDTLLRIARNPPASRNELRLVKGVTPYVQRRHGEAIMKAIQQGLSRGKPPAPRRRPPRGPRLTPGQQRRMESLKQWRKEKAAERGVPTLAVLPNHAILEVVQARPREPEELAELATVGHKRARLYGQDIIRIVR
jgi:ribonuclease D